MSQCCGHSLRKARKLIGVLDKSEINYQLYNYQDTAHVDHVKLAERSFPKRARIVEIKTRNSDDIFANSSFILSSFLPKILAL